MLVCWFVGEYILPCFSWSNCAAAWFRLLSMRVNVRAGASMCARVWMFAWYYKIVFSSMVRHIPGSYARTLTHTHTHTSILFFFLSLFAVLRFWITLRVLFRFIFLFIFMIIVCWLLASFSVCAIVCALCMYFFHSIARLCASLWAVDVPARTACILD